MGVVLFPGSHLSRLSDPSLHKQRHPREGIDRPSRHAHCMSKLLLRFVCACAVHRLIRLNKKKRPKSRLNAGVSSR